MAQDGIAKGHAYSLIFAREVRLDDGQTVMCVQPRNPCGANFAAVYKGELCDTWKGWAQSSEVRRELLGEFSSVGPSAPQSAPENAKGKNAKGCCARAEQVRQIFSRALCLMEHLF